MGSSPKNLNFVINYSLSRHSKPVRPFFIFEHKYVAKIVALLSMDFIKNILIRNVLVFSNPIYHDNEHARYCYRGHFKKTWIIIYYKLF